MFLLASLPVMLHLWEFLTGKTLRADVDATIAGVKDATTVSFYIRYQGGPSIIFGYIQLQKSAMAFFSTKLTWQI